MKKLLSLLCLTISLGQALAQDMDQAKLISMPLQTVFTVKKEIRILPTETSYQIGYRSFWNRQTESSDSLFCKFTLGGKYVSQDKLQVIAVNRQFKVTETSAQWVKFSDPTVTDSWFGILCTHAPENIKDLRELITAFFTFEMPDNTVNFPDKKSE